jgi:hemolysin III
MTDRRSQTRAEELANALTHGAGLALSLVGLPVAAAVALRHGDLRQVVAASLFATTLVLLYAASTAYTPCATTGPSWCCGGSTMSRFIS